MREGELGRLSWTAATIDEHPESEEKGEDGRSRLRTWINMCRGGAVLPSNTLSDEAFIEGACDLATCRSISDNN